MKLCCPNEPLIGILTVEPPATLLALIEIEHGPYGAIGDAWHVPNAFKLTPAGNDEVGGITRYDAGLEEYTMSLISIWLNEVGQIRAIIPLPVEHPDEPKFKLYAGKPLNSYWVGV